jgi:hypothetical protein
MKLLHECDHVSYTYHHTSDVNVSIVYGSPARRPPVVVNLHWQRHVKMVDFIMPRKGTCGSSHQSHDMSHPKAYFERLNNVNTRQISTP